MKILLDENLPESLVDLIADLGHEVDSVNSLNLKGIENGELYSEVAVKYDLCFTKDAGFAHNIRQNTGGGEVKLLWVKLFQEPVPEFCQKFIRAFKNTDWPELKNGQSWPRDQ